MNPVLAVHERLMQMLPVRTVAARPREEQPQESVALDVAQSDGARRRRNPEQAMELAQHIDAMVKAGKRNFEIADELNLSRTTVGNYVRCRLKVLKERGARG